MRRSEREIRNRDLIEELLRRAPVCRLGMAPLPSARGSGDPGADGVPAADPHAGYPYVIPLHFVYAEGLIYIHSARQGRKIEMVRADPRVCLEIDEFLELKPADRACDFATRYRSLLAFGRARIVEDAEEKHRALRLLMEKYAGRSFDFPQREIEEVAIIEVRIDELSGKEG